MANTKMTKKEMYVVVRGIVETAGNMEAVAFIDHEIELLNRKSSKTTLTKTQVENLAIMEQLLEELKRINKPVTISEFMKESEIAGRYNNQKLSALLTKMLGKEEDGPVVRTVEKKKAYFSVR